MFETITLTQQQLFELKELINLANTPDDSELEHYTSSVLGIVVRKKEVQDGAIPLALSINNNTKLVDCIKKYTNLDNNSINSIHTITYPEGSWAKNHRDSNSTNTFVFILQNAQQGGSSVFNNIEYNFPEGTILNYNGSKILHGTTPVVKGVRKTLVLWYGGKTANKSSI